MSGAAFTQFDRQCTLCSSKRMVAVLVDAWTMMLVVVGVLEMERAAFTQFHRQCSLCGLIVLSWWE